MPVLNESPVPIHVPLSNHDLRVLVVSKAPATRLRPLGGHALDVACAAPGALSPPPTATSTSAAAAKRPTRSDTATQLHLPAHSESLLIPTVTPAAPGTTTLPPSQQWRATRVVATALTARLRPQLLSLEAARRVLPAPTAPISAFHSRDPPPIALEPYLLRVARFARASPSTLVCTAVLLKRFRRCTAVALSDLNIHRLLISAVMLATKMFHDRTYSPAFYARIGGVASVEELAVLEACFLRAVGFDLFVSDEEFRDMLEELAASSPELRTVCDEFEADGFRH